MDINLNELTFENIGSWPNWIKMLVVVVVFIVILSLGYWFDNSDQLNLLHKKQMQEISLRKSLEAKQQLAVNLPAYRQQLIKVTKIFNSLLDQLPTRSEVPGLLEDISKTGVANGLQFKLFKPQPEKQKAFYAELPIKISVVGNYHQIAKFISEVAGLDRIVTLHNFTLETPGANPRRTRSASALKELKGKLVLDITAKTYRYTGE